MICNRRRDLESFLCSKKNSGQDISGQKFFLAFMTKKEDTRKRTTIRLPCSSRKILWSETESALIPGAKRSPGATNRRVACISCIRQRRCSLSVQQTGDSFALTLKF
jgi:hypothetical protein